MSKPRILLADDHTLVAEAFSRLLEPQFEVVGTASDGRVLLEKAEQLRPDVQAAQLPEYLHAEIALLKERGAAEGAHQAGPVATGVSLRPPHSVQDPS